MANTWILNMSQKTVQEFFEIKLHNFNSISFRDIYIVFRDIFKMNRS